MSRLDQKIEELIKRVDALQASINTLTALVNAKFPTPYAPAVTDYPIPSWPWPLRPPSYPPYTITSSSNAKGEK